MTRHLLDRTPQSALAQDKTDARAQVRAFMSIARTSRENPLWRQMHRAARLEKPQPLRETLRIARGHLA